MRGAAQELYTVKSYQSLLRNAHKEMTSSTQTIKTLLKNPINRLPGISKMDFENSRKRNFTQHEFLMHDVDCEEASEAESLEDEFETSDEDSDIMKLKKKV